MPRSGRPWPSARSPCGRGSPPLGVPDGFAYEITVDHTTVYCADPRLTEDQRELIRRVLKEGA